MSLRRHVIAGATIFGVVGFSSIAHATGVTEFPDNGSEQSGRGGAWIARASDPLAAFYNPAGLAGQPTRLILQSNINFQRTCFKRLKASNDKTTEPDGTLPGQSFPNVCSSDGAGVDPQLAMTFKVNNKIGIGFAPLLAPSAGASSVKFPQFFDETKNGSTIVEPGTTRYLLTSANLLVLNPTIGIGVEVVDRLRLGASFQWGIASLQFTNGVAASANLGETDNSTDIRAKTSVTDFFVPGFTLGAIYSATDDIDIAAWYKWSDSIKASGDIQTTTTFYSQTSGNANGDTSQANCGIPNGKPICGSGNNVHVTVAEPMEAKLGFRYHKRRSDVPYDEHVRDPMSQDVFDIETDLTWANNSSFTALQVRLPSNGSGEGVIPINGILGVTAPPNADIPDGYKDVYGIRLGGDYNVIRDQLALRAGGFFQSNGQNPTYQDVLFAATANVGLAGGATYRIHLSKDKGNALEVSLGYEHVFYLSSTNDGPNGVDALAGSACNGGSLTNFKCPNGATPYRSPWPINLGTITNSINVLNVGIGYKF